MLRATTIDDRGKRVPLVPYRLRGVVASDEQSIAARQLRRSKPGPGDVARGLVFGAVGLVLITLATLAPAYLAFSLNLAGWAKVLAMVMAILGPGAVVFFLVRRHSANHIARTHALAGMCGSCGYDLRATTVQVDGCKVCPECGAAWRCV